MKPTTDIDDAIKALSDECVRRLILSVSVNVSATESRILYTFFRKQKLEELLHAELYQWLQSHFLPIIGYPHGRIASPAEQHVFQQLLQKVVDEIGFEALQKNYKCST
jgi:hypothetical protein